MNVLEVINVTREVTWLPWAVQYFFLIGISVACLLMSLPGGLSKLDVHDALTRNALIGALVCGLVAPVALLADLHQPGRFWRFYASPNLRSWMAWGAFFIPLYLAFMLAYTWALLSPAMARSASEGEGLLSRIHGMLALGSDTARTIARVSGILTAIFGLLIFLYTGMELMVVRARPLWATPFLPLQLVATSFVGAGGLVLVLNRVLGDGANAGDASAMRWLRTGLLCTIALGLAWLAVAALGLDATHAKALATVAGHKSWQITAVWAAAATIVPLALSLIAPHALDWLIGLLALHAAWMFRWTVFIGGQTVPKTGAGLYDYHLPLGREGLLGIAGTAGLWLAVLIILTALLPSARTTVAAEPKLAPAE